MHQLDTVRYAKDESLQLAELPYAGGRLAMTILLPRNVDGLAQLESALNPDSLTRWLGLLTRTKVELFLPRFKLESSLALAPILEKMGMPDAFHPNADFSGMDGAHDLFISSVSHKAYVAVSEQGTEAAAATVGAVALTSAVVQSPPPPPIFRADHPFLFLVRDTRSGSILFLGRLYDPTN